VSEKPRPQRRRATRTESRKAQTRSRPAARSGGAGFLDYLIIALLVGLALMLVAVLVLVLRVF
jgi:uncharacterized RDD family membrane protein YckC